MSAKVQRLFGVDSTKFETLVIRVTETAASAYWAAIDEAIGEALKRARVWDGTDEKLEQAQEYAAGQVGLEGSEDGSIKILLFGELAATISAPSFELPEQPSVVRILQ